MTHRGRAVGGRGISPSMGRSDFHDSLLAIQWFLRHRDGWKRCSSSSLIPLSIPSRSVDWRWLMVGSVLGIRVRSGVGCSSGVGIGIRRGELVVRVVHVSRPRSCVHDFPSCTLFCRRSKGEAWKRSRRVRRRRETVVGGLRARSGESRFGGRSGDDVRWRSLPRSERMRWSIGMGRRDGEVGRTGEDGRRSEGES